MDAQQLRQVVTAAQAGDAKALNTLFENYYNDVYYFALKTVKDEEIACDVTQETFVEIIRTIRDLQAPEAFVAWMRQITYHQCTRYFKKKKEVLVEEDEDGNSVFDTLVEDKTEFIPDAALDQAELRKTILHMLDTLSEEQRSAVLLYYFDELSVNQIAQIQGVSEGTVKSRLNYARKGLKQSVEDYEKKTGVKLRCVGVLPLLLWLLRGSKTAMPTAAVKAVASGVSAATGIHISAGVAAAATAAAGTALGTKIVAGVLAAGLVVSGGIGVGMLSDRHRNTDGQGVVGETTEETTAPEDSPAKPTEPEDSPAKPTEPAGSEEVPAEQGIVPAECVYIDANGKEYLPGEEMPAPTYGDEFHTASYIYKLGYGLWRQPNQEGWSLYWAERYEGAGWGVQVTDTGLMVYPDVLSEINGRFVENMDYTYERCDKLLVAPQIPETVKTLMGTFYGCSVLIRPPVLPEGIVDLFDTFAYCYALIEMPRIPASVTSMTQTFHNCHALTKITALPDGLTDAYGTFANCYRLKTAPALPDGIVDIAQIFMLCESLTEAPRLPDSIENMRHSFFGCNSLTAAPKLPESVTCLDHCFEGCTALVTAPTIPQSVQSMTYAFYGCSSLTGTVRIDADVRRVNCQGSCDACQSGVPCTECWICENDLYMFTGTVLPIVITGKGWGLKLLMLDYENVTLR